ncbi:MAG TPA: type II secretion system F family protein [Acidobacteriaceae bacterium]|nr:type II secretion system F family protein [Acidobacteriaceae bacterium]
MTTAIISFCAVFLLLSSAGLLLFYREAMLQRISYVVNPRPKKSDLADVIQQTGQSITGLVGQLDRVLPKSQQELSVIQQRLVRAGYRNDSAPQVFYGAKVLTPIVLCLMMLVSGVMSASPLFAWALGLGGGFILPDFWLGRMIARRQKQIRRGLPDALDFMVICIEAGLGLDQATARTATELATAHPALSDELEVVMLETRAGRARSDAWKQFGDRTAVDSVRVLATILVQAEQLGTSVSKTLRIHSETMRTKRRQQIEEKAAKTTVKLVFPLVLCIFPSLFVVLLGPSAILMAEAFSKDFK